MDLRDFIALCEKENDLKRITAEVDWDLEMTHISKLVEEKDGRACLFENVKGQKGSVFFGAYSSTKRLAMALGKPIVTGPHMDNFALPTRALTEREALVQVRGPTALAGVIGDLLARETVPQKLVFPRGSRTDAVLHLRVASGFALELQHIAPQIIERMHKLITELRSNEPSFRLSEREAIENRESQHEDDHEVIEQPIELKSKPVVLAEFA